MLVLTRKGLFVFERGAGGWRMVQPRLPGRPRVDGAADPRDGALYAALDLGHFGAKLHRSTRRRRDLGRDRRAASIPTSPRAASTTTRWAQAVPWTLERSGRSTAGGTDAAGAALGRHPPRRPVPLATTAASPGSSSGRSGTRPNGKSWFGGGADFPGIHSRLRRPARRSARARRRLLRRRLDDRRRRRHLELPRRRACAPTSCRPSVQLDPNIQDAHRMVQCPGRPRHAVGAAPQRHLPQHRRRAQLAATSNAPARRPSASPSRCTRRTPTRRGSCPAVKDETRMPVDGQRRRHPHARRRTDLRRAAQRPAAAARLRPRLPPRARHRRRAATASRSARTTGGAVGHRERRRPWTECRRTCRRSTPCAGYERRHTRRRSSSIAVISAADATQPRSVPVARRVACHTGWMPRY